jgi:hypothetical protein
LNLTSSFYYQIKYLMVLSIEYSFTQLLLCICHGYYKTSEKQSIMFAMFISSSETNVLYGRHWLDESGRVRKS